MGKENMDNQPEEKTGKSLDSKVPADERYSVEDRVMKDAAWFLGKELLPLHGIKGTFKRAAPTEAVFLEISDFMADFNHEMEDGTWKHLEFESDSISVEDLRRFRACEAILSYRYMVEVFTYVLCTSKVKVLRNRLRQADKIIKRIEKKQEKERPSREGLLKILLAPLMDGEITQFERI